MRRAALGLGVVMVLAGCVQGPDFKPPAPPVPAAWSRAWPGTAAVLGATSWWEAFDDPALASLIDRARDESPDVRVALARIAESRANLAQQNVPLLPSLEGSASYNRERPSAEGVLSLTGGRPSVAPRGAAGATAGISHPAARDFDLFQYGFDASWEPDFWGKIARGVEAADAALLASREARIVALGTMATEIGRNYILLRSVQADLQMAGRMLDLDRQTVRLTRSRVTRGFSTDIDLSNAEAAVALAEADLAPLRTTEQSYRNAIAQLLGLPPGALDGALAQPRPIPSLRRPIPLSLPSGVAHARPDIREAVATLRQATANIGVARADFFPQVTLSGSFAFQALQFSGGHGLDVWGAHQFAAGPQVTVPIFDAGRVAANVRLAEAQQVEAFESYRRVVLQALHDVENSLNSLQHDRTRADALTVQADRLWRSYQLQVRLTQSGLSDALRDLDTERGWLAAAQSHSDAKAVLAADQIATIKSLGLGWPSSGDDAALAIRTDAENISLTARQVPIAARAATTGAHGRRIDDGAAWTGLTF